MYAFISNLLQYTGSYYNNIDQYIIYASLAIILLLVVLLFDLFYRLMRSIIKK